MTAFYLSNFKLSVIIVMPSIDDSYHNHALCTNPLSNIAIASKSPRREDKAALKSVTVLNRCDTSPSKNLSSFRVTNLDGSDSEFVFALSAKLGKDLIEIPILSVTLLPRY